MTVQFNASVSNWTVMTLMFFGTESDVAKRLKSCQTEHAT
jgi:hypothetical protein